MGVDNTDYEVVMVPGVRALKSTAYALLCLQIATGKQAWMPQSQIHEDSDVFEAGHEGKLAIPRWLAEREGFV